MTVSELISESMVYERAQAELGRILGRLYDAMNEDRAAARRNGTDHDPYFRVLIDALRPVRESLQARSAKLWSEAESGCEPHAPSVEALAHAVVLDAIQSYENAVCFGDRYEMEDVEQFVRDDAQIYTDVDLEPVLERIRAAAPAFLARARDNLPQLLSERKSMYGKHKVRCPLCGGVMYCVSDNRWRQTASRKIRCGGCSLFCVLEDPA